MKTCACLPSFLLFASIATFASGCALDQAAASEPTASEEAAFVGVLPMREYRGWVKGLALTRYDTCVTEGGTKCIGATRTTAQGGVIDRTAQWTFPGQLPAPSTIEASGGVVCVIGGQDLVVGCFGHRITIDGFFQSFPVPGIAGAMQVAFPYVLRGDNEAFRIGLPGSGEPALTPVASHVWAVAQSAEGLCIVTDSSEVQCGGRTVPNVSHVKQLACGTSHCCAVETGGAVACWGENAKAQLGDGMPSAFKTSAVRVHPLDRATAITVGDDYSCAMLADDTLRCWGSNERGQLGALLPTGAGQWYPPVTVHGMRDVYRLTAGPQHACAISWEGKVWCWGANEAGQLGTNAAGTTDSSVPVKLGGLLL